jgi:putative transposase
MGIEAIYRKPRTSIANLAHRVYPYLLKDVAIERPNQAWAADISYIPMARGFGYLVAIIDLYSRKVMAHRLSNTMTTDFCIEALDEALTRFGAPEIFNTDQGAQFTDTDFTDRLKAHGIAISMDGKRRWIDKAYVSYCTSVARSATSVALKRCVASLEPCALRGASSPGGSYRHSFLSL